MNEDAQASGQHLPVHLGPGAHVSSDVARPKRRPPLSSCFRVLKKYLDTNLAMSRGRCFCHPSERSVKFGTTNLRTTDSMFTTSLTKTRSLASASLSHGGKESWKLAQECLHLIFLSRIPRSLFVL